MKMFIMFLLIIFSVSVYSHDWHEGPKLTNNDLLSVSAPDDSVAWICGKSGTVLLTLTGGRVWIDKSENPAFTGLDLVHIFGLNANTAIIIANPVTDKALNKTTAYLFRTIDRGLSWQKVMSIDGGYGNAVYMTDSKHGVFYCNPVNGKWPVFLTNDGGNTWDSAGVKIASPMQDEVSYTNGIFGDMIFSRSLLFGTNKGRYFASYDLGKTWIIKEVPGLTEVHAIAFADSANGVAAGTGLFKTTDGGNTWKDNSAAALGKGTITSIICHDFWNFFIIRTGSGDDFGNRVYHSGNFTDDNWDTAYTAWDQKPFLHLVQVRNGGYAYGLRQGGGISIAVHDDPPVTEVKEKSNAPAEYSLSQNFPNPFNPETKINYSLPQNSFVTLKVYDLLGNLVASLVNENKPAGNYSVIFNASSLPSGLYIYEIRAGNSYTMTRKMAFIK